MPQTNTPRTILNIPYSSDDTPSSTTRRALDLYAPPSGTNLPVIAYIHGGGWRYGDRKDVYHKPAAFTARGFIFVSLGYRLVPEVRNAGQCTDLADGLRWVHDHIVEHGGDPARIHLLGWSAGGPLAATLAADPRYLRAAGVPASAIRTVTGLDGDCYDIPRQLEMTDAKTHAYHMTVWGADPNGWIDPSPITHLAPGRHYPAFLLVHLASRPDSRFQADTFAARCHTVGATAKVLAADTTHEALNKDLGLDTDATTADFYRFLAEHE